MTWASDAFSDRYSRTYSKSASLMWGFLCPRTKLAGPTSCPAVEGGPTLDVLAEAIPNDPEIFTGYTSDQSEDDVDDADTDDADDANDANDLDDVNNLDDADNANDADNADNEHGPGKVGLNEVGKCERTPRALDSVDIPTPRCSDTLVPVPPISLFGIMERKRHAAAAEATVPPRKRQRRATTPIRIQRNGRKNEMECIQRSAMADLERMIGSTQAKFDGGPNGLQARRARTVHSYLHMLVRNNRRKTEASERAAEAQGFAAQWGGRQVRSWSKLWIEERKLPKSRHGKHIKLFTLLEDPNIRAELQSYVRSNKWAVDPAKLAEFSTKKMVPKVAEAYGTNLMKKEIPLGLKQYLELELFPRIHMKVIRGVSLSTARRWLHREGFRFTEHRKVLYFDGHERSDVVDYRQNSFIPQMKEYRRWLVEYVVGEVAREKEKLVDNLVERRLVLVSHDESTAQANDGKKMSWVHAKEHALKKKGAGRGIHQSDVICSTVGWLKGASQSLEYGKNYEGYWNGELFVKQVHCNWTR